MIKDIVQGAVKSAGAWVGNLVAGPKGAVVGERLASSLMENYQEMIVGLSLLVQ